jgi:hypothetical protein
MRCDVEQQFGHGILLRLSAIGDRLSAVKKSAGLQPFIECCNPAEFPAQCRHYL